MDAMNTKTCRAIASAFAVALCAAAPSLDAATLPRFAKLVEYIQSDGSQWINTGFTPSNNNVRIEVKYQYVTLPEAGSRTYVFGSKYSVNNTNIRLQYAVGDAGNCFIGYGDTNKTTTFDSYDTDTIHTIVCSNGVFSLDGTTSSDWDLSSATFTETTDEHPVYLFGHNASNGGSASYTSAIRLYSCRIWDNDELVHDFLPVAYGSSGSTSGCLFDNVSGDVLENAGSGSFSFGDDVTSYTRLSYIETVEKAALVNTYYTPDSNTELEMQFAFTKELEAKAYVFGVYGSNSGGRLQFSYGPTSTGCFLGYGTAYSSSVSGITYDMSKHIVKYVKGEGFYFDGTLVGGTTDFTTWSGTSHRLFLAGLNPNGTAVNAGHIPPIRIYYCKIWDASTLVRDYVPRQRNLDGMCGLLDKVSGEFYSYWGDRGAFTGRKLVGGLIAIIR